MPSPIEFDGLDRPIEDYEYPDESDWTDDDDIPRTTPCPNCGSEIYFDSEWCSACGEYIDLNARTRKHSNWVIAVIIIVIFAFATTMIFW